MTRVWFGLGANLGDRQANIERAIGQLGDRISIARRSDFIDTKPVDAGGGDYLNCVAGGDTDLEPLELLEFTQGIEREMGRTGKGTNGPRPIDIDILFYGDLILRTPDLIIPHPRLHERAFVLDPLSSLEPGLLHPVDGRSVLELSEALPRTYL